MRWQSELSVVRPKGCLLKNLIKKSQFSIVLSPRAAHKNVTVLPK